MKLRKWLPILEWLPTYNRKTLRGDILAGLTVCVILVPQGMAYAFLAGLPLIYGLYAGIVPLILYVFFGTSRQLSVGPVALSSLLVLASLSILAKPESDTYIVLAIVAALVTGVFQLALGVFRLGFLINFISRPVVSGFTSAAALIIGFSQLKNVLGIDIPDSSQIYKTIAYAATHLYEINWPTFIISVSGLALIIVLKKINRAIPNALIAVTIATVITGLIGLDEFGVAIVGEVPSGLPKFIAPELSMDNIKAVLPLALTLTLIGLIESVAIAKTIEARHKDYKIDPNQELIALGLSKIGGAFFQAYPTTGSFTRSAINDEAGAKTGISSIVAAALVALTLLFLTPLFYYLPKAILASIIIAAVLNLIQFKEIFRLWRIRRGDALMLIATFVITVVFGISEGVLAGVALSLALMIYRSSRPSVAVLGRLPNSTHYRNTQRFPEAQEFKDVLILRFDAPLYFGNINYFVEVINHLIAQRQEKLGLVVLDASAIYDMDSDGLSTLQQVIDEVTKDGTKFYVTGALGNVRDLLYKAGLMDAIGHQNQFMYVHDAIEYYHAHPDSDAKNWNPNVLQTNVKKNEK